MKSIIVILLSAVFAAPLASQWVNNQAAEFVIGQQNKTSSGPRGASSTTFSGYSYGIAFDQAHGKLYIADGEGNRVLRYPYPVTGDMPVADLVFGQTNMTSASQGCSATELDFPNGCVVYNGDLWVADMHNHRLVKYPSAWSASSNGPAATVVLGQPNDVSNASSCTQTGLYLPNHVCFDGSGNLWVSDLLNFRVLEYANASAKATGAPADKVLGAPDFTTVNEARVVSQKDFPYPYGVCSDGTTLWVAEGYAHRVLRFDNAASKSNYANADGVLGAADYIKHNPSASASTFNFPDATAIDGSGTLYVGDCSNYRVMIFKNAYAKANGAAADFVLGATRLDLAGYSTPTSASSVSGVSGMAIDNATGKLFVSVAFDSRVLIFASVAGSLPVELVSFAANVNGSSVTLDWKTATEVNNYGFDIERKSAINWSKVGFIEGHGTTNAAQSYSYSDNNAIGKVSYRLKQIDRDGKFIYSKEVETTVEAPTVFALLQNYPNPFNPTTVIGYSIASASHVSLKVFDLLGREIAVLVNTQMAPGSHTAQFDASRLSSGVYFYKLDVGSFSDVKRLSIMK